MACWPATIVGAFFIVLILFDVSIHNYNDLPMHGVTGILMTLVFWVICATLGQSLSAAVLVVPATFTTIFILGIWVAKKSLQNRGCCVTCGTVGSACSCPSDETTKTAEKAPSSKEGEAKKDSPSKPKCTPDKNSKQGIINLNAGFFE